MRLEIDFHDEREFRRWRRTIGVQRSERAIAAINRVASLGGSWAGFPLVRHLGRGLYEIRRGGDRIYFAQSPHRLTILAAGNKDTQARDIERARRRMT